MPPEGVLPKKRDIRTAAGTTDTCFSNLKGTKVKACCEPRDENKNI